MGLMPSMLSITAEKGFYEDAKAYNLFDCFELRHLHVRLPVEAADRSSGASREVADQAVTRGRPGAAPGNCGR